MRVLCCGDRSWADCQAIEDELRALGTQTRDITVIHGACRGADNIAGRVAHILGYTVVRYPALWSKYGKGAGPIRNQQMIDEGKPDCALAFHHDIANSKGTADMVRRLKAANIPCKVVYS